MSGDFKDGVDFDGSGSGQRSDAHSRPCVAAPIAEGHDHQVRRAIQNDWPLFEIRLRILKTSRRTTRAIASISPSATLAIDSKLMPHCRAARMPRSSVKSEPSFPFATRFPFAA
jgi:hypothetical protein